jgi:protease I
MVQYFAQANKPIAAICHGAQLLVAANAVRGKRCSAYPACGPDVTMAGGIHAEIAMHEAIVDGNLVTAPAWPAHPQWLMQFLKLLGTRIEHTQLTSV